MCEINEMHPYLARIRINPTRHKECGLIGRGSTRTFLELISEPRHNTHTHATCGKTCPASVSHRKRKQSQDNVNMGKTSNYTFCDNWFPRRDGDVCVCAQVLTICTENKSFAATIHIAHSPSSFTAAANECTRFYRRRDTHDARRTPRIV